VTRTGKTMAGDHGANRRGIGLVQGTGKGFPQMIVKLNLSFH